MSTLLFQPRDFGTLLRERRRAAGLTQEQLAEQAGISADAISTLERGTRQAPHEGTLQRLAEALQLSSQEQYQWKQAVRGKRSPGYPSVESLRALALDRSDQVPISPVLTSQQPAARRAFQASLPTLIGREQELRDICALLQRPEVRLLTLTGSAGIGKTRLALQVATDLARSFADGVQVVFLATQRDPALVSPA